MATLFEAYVTNAGKYSEGQLVGETLKFPTTAQEVEALLKRIDVDGVRYQEIFITSFDGDVLGLYSGTYLCQCAAAYQSGEGKEDIFRSDIRSCHQGADHDGRWKGYRLRADAPHHR